MKPVPPSVPPSFNSVYQIHFFQYIKFTFWQSLRHFQDIQKHGLCLQLRSTFLGPLEITNYKRSKPLRLIADSHINNSDIHYTFLFTLDNFKSHNTIIIYPLDEITLKNTKKVSRLWSLKSWSIKLRVRLCPQLNPFGFNSFYPEPPESFSNSCKLAAVV